MPDKMHWLCLIIEMLNKYLQMADPSFPGRARIVINEPSARVEEVAAIVSAWRPDPTYMFFMWCDAHRGPCADMRAAAATSLDGINSDCVNL